MVDGVTGVVVSRPEDAQAVASALGRLLDDAELRRRLGEQARARAVGEFDRDRLAARLGAALATLA